MNRYLVAAAAGIVGGALLTTQVAGPLLAQEQDCLLYTSDAADE